MQQARHSNRARILDPIPGTRDHLGRTGRVLVALIAVAALPGAGAAQGLVPTAQDRRVTATIETTTFPNPPVQVQESESAPDYGPFTASVDGWPDPPPWNAPSAWHSSSIDSVGMSALGRVKATPGGAPLFTQVEEHMESVFLVEFDVAEEVPFTLSGTLGMELGYCDSDVSGWIRLTGPAGVIAEVAESFGATECWGAPCAASHPISADGVLVPGSYTLEAEVVANAKEIIYPDKICVLPDPLGTYEVALQLEVPQVPALPSPLMGVLLGSVTGGVVLRALVARRRARKASGCGTPA